VLLCLGGGGLTALGRLLQRQPMGPGAFTAPAITAPGVSWQAPTSVPLRLRPQPRPTRARAAPARARRRPWRPPRPPRRRCSAARAPRPTDCRRSGGERGGDRGLWRPRRWQQHTVPPLQHGPGRAHTRATSRGPGARPPRPLTARPPGPSPRPTCRARLDAALHRLQTNLAVLGDGGAPGGRSSPRTVEKVMARAARMRDAAGAADQSPARGGTAPGGAAGGDGEAHESGADATRRCLARELA
jgi:hypothetical protein